jgi:hypothetical protein
MQRKRSDWQVMSEPKNPDPGQPGAQSPARPADDKKRSGRAGFDERGNSVWEWQLETGVYSRDITTQRLKKLDLDDLSIAETATHRRPTEPDARQERAAAPGGGFNPYDTAASRDVGGNPYDTARGTGKRMQPAPGAPAPRRPVDLQRLDEWLKIKKRLDDAKKDEPDDD